MVDINLVEGLRQIDPADYLVHVQRLDDNVDHPLGDSLGERLHRIGHVPPGGAQSVERIHGIKSMAAPVGGNRPMRAIRVTRFHTIQVICVRMLPHG